LSTEYSALFDECTRMWVMLLVTFILVYVHIFCYICCKYDTEFEWLWHSQHLFSICLLHYFSTLVICFAWAYIILFDETCDKGNHMLMVYFCRYQFTLMTFFVCIWTPYVVVACKIKYGGETGVIRGSVPAREQPLSVLDITVSSYVPTLGEICCICHCLYIDPVILSCKHSYCLACITKWETINHRCPICRRQINVGQCVYIV
jgi:hypothetical protein